MKKKMMALFAGLLLAGQVLPVHALDNDLAILSTGGIVAAALACSSEVARTNDVAGAAVGVAGLLVGALVASRAEYFNYRWINKHLDFIELQGHWTHYAPFLRKKNYLFITEITDQNFDTVLMESDCESVDFPLVAMFKKLQAADAILVKLRDTSDRILFNTIRKSSSFYKKAEVQHTRLDAIIVRVRNNISAIKRHSMWIDQWKMYQMIGKNEGTGKTPVVGVLL